MSGRFALCAALCVALPLAVPSFARAEQATPLRSTLPNATELRRLQDSIDAALQAPTLVGAHVGVLVLDAATGTPLYARNAADDFVPASTLKLIVGSAALARLGPAFTFTTEVKATGGIADGTLHGDLYLRGGGDAQLSIDDLAAASRAVSAAGIRRITGSLIADASRYDAPRYPPGWAIDDIPYEYAAVPAALGLDLNVAHVRISPGAIAGDPAVLHVLPQSDAFAVENAVVTGARGSADTTDLERAWDRPRTIRVVGSYPLGELLSDDLVPAVPEPAQYAADAFATALTSEGVTIAGGIRFGITPAGATTLWTHRSKSLDALLRDFWPPSTNLIGEQLLEELGAQAKQREPGDGSRSTLDVRVRGIADEIAWLQSIGVSGDTVTLDDGSGLSAYDRATPRALVSVLQTDWRTPERDAVIAALPVAGTSGTLQSRFGSPPLRGAVFAKTGSLNHARLLAGYVRTERGSTAIFALMINDWMGDSDRAEAALDAVRATILTAIVRL